MGKPIPLEGTGFPAAGRGVGGMVGVCASEVIWGPRGMLGPMWGVDRLTLEEGGEFPVVRPDLGVGSLKRSQFIDLENAVLTLLGGGLGSTFWAVEFDWLEVLLSVGS